MAGNINTEAYSCDHSFNSDGCCEYCGLSDDDFDESCSNGEPIGVYQ